jgi:hypothetical protein
MAHADLYGVHGPLTHALTDYFALPQTRREFGDNFWVFERLGQEWDVGTPGHSQSVDISGIRNATLGTIGGFSSQSAMNAESVTTGRSGTGSGYKRYKRRKKSYKKKRRMKAKRRYRKKKYNKAMVMRRAQTDATTVGWNAIGERLGPAVGVLGTDMRLLPEKLSMPVDWHYSAVQPSFGNAASSTVQTLTDDIRLNSIWRPSFANNVTGQHTPSRGSAVDYHDNIARFYEKYQVYAVKYTVIIDFQTNDIFPGLEQVFLTSQVVTDAADLRQDVENEQIASNVSNLEYKQVTMSHGDVHHYRVAFTKFLRLSDVLHRNADEQSDWADIGSNPAQVITWRLNAYRPGWDFISNLGPTIQANTTVGFVSDIHVRFYTNFSTREKNNFGQGTG